MRVVFRLVMRSIALMTDLLALARALWPCLKCQARTEEAEQLNAQHRTLNWDIVSLAEPAPYLRDLEHLKKVRVLQFRCNKAKQTRIDME